MSSQRFIKYIPSDETSYLRRKHPNAFLLLSLIAERSRRISGSPDGLQIGESHIGDYEEAGIETRDKYRTALHVLISRKHIEKVETCRNRKKCPTGSPTIGTKVKILNSGIWDINSNDDPHRLPYRTPTGPPPDPHEQERSSCYPNGQQELLEKKDEERKDVLEEIPKKENEEKNDPSSIVAFSSFLEQESGIVPSEVRVFVENNKINLANTDLEAWCAIYDTERVVGTLQLMINQNNPVKNPGGWLLIAFKENYFQRDKNWKICQKFNREFPFIKLKVLKSYAVASDNEELHYSMSQDELVRKLNMLIQNRNKTA